jgi:hypothetical protein
MNALLPPTPQSDDLPVSPLLPLFPPERAERVNAAIIELFKHFPEITPARLALQASCSRDVAHTALVRLVLTGRAILLCGDRVGRPQLSDALLAVLEWEG